MTLYKRQHHIISYYHYFLTKSQPKTHVVSRWKTWMRHQCWVGTQGVPPFKEWTSRFSRKVGWFWIIICCDFYVFLWCFNVMLWQTQSPCDYECLWLNTLVFVDVILISHNLFWAEENRKNMARAKRSQFFKFLGLHCFSLLHKKSRFQGLSNFHKGSNVVQARYLLTSRPISTGWTNVKSASHQGMVPCVTRLANVSC